MKIGWIGLGNMGVPMSSNLVKAEKDVVVWNRTKSKGDDVVALGATFGDSPKAVAEACDCIFTMVADGKALHDAVLGDDGIVAGLSPGKIVIDMSTVSVAESATVNEAVEAAGCKFLRAPVTGSTALAAAGTVGVLASGDKECYDKILPLFEILGNPEAQFYLGGADEARVMKLSLNSMIATTMQMEAEAVVMAEKAGLDVQQVCDIIANSAAGSPLTKYKAAVIGTGNYAPAFPVRLMIKDLNLALAVAEQYGVPMPNTKLTLERLELADSKGYGDSDFAVLTKVLEEESGIDR